MSKYRPDQKARRQKEAQIRQAAYDSLSLQEKLEKLNDFCRITGAACLRQRTRLELELAKSGVAIEPVSKKKEKRVKAKDRRAAEQIAAGEDTGE